MAKHDELMTFAEAGRLLRTSPRTLFRMLDDGRLRGYRLSSAGPWRFTREQLMAALTDSATVAESFVADDGEVSLGGSARREAERRAKARTA